MFKNFTLQIALSLTCFTSVSLAMEASVLETPARQQVARQSQHAIDIARAALDASREGSRTPSPTTMSTSFGGTLALAQAALDNSPVRSSDSNRRPSPATQDYEVILREAQAALRGIGSPTFSERSGSSEVEHRSFDEARDAALAALHSPISPSSPSVVTSPIAGSLQSPEDVLRTAAAALARSRTPSPVSREGLQDDQRDISGLAYTALVTPPRTTLTGAPVMSPIDYASAIKRMPTQSRGPGLATLLPPSGEAPNSPSTPERKRGETIRLIPKAEEPKKNSCCTVQ